MLVTWPGEGRGPGPWEKAVLGDLGGAGGVKGLALASVWVPGGPGLLSFALYWRKVVFLVPQVWGLDALEKVGK